MNISFHKLQCAAVQKSVLLMRQEVEINTRRVEEASVKQVELGQEIKNFEKQNTLGNTQV